LEDLNAKPQLTPAESEKVSALSRERDELKKQVDGLTKDLANAEAKRDEDVLAAQTEVEKLRAQLKDGGKSLDQTQLTAALDSSSKKKVEQMKEKILQLSDRLAVYEAQRIAPTAEELALFKKADKQPAPAPKDVHSMKDLSDNARGLMAEGEGLYAAKDYTGAEAKYREALKDDPKNIYVIATIANVQMTMAKYKQCEKTVQQGLKLDPDDAGSLYILGKLRLLEDKVDEALDLLSRSARIKATPQTENALGSALSRKGMREPAETALRNALEIDPNYADAHQNLALVYATDNPPSVELAKWHYKKAIDNGYPQDPQLEKLLK
jgi:tetratricopeptide (TPR) repeat protein